MARSECEVLTNRQIRDVVARRVQTRGQSHVRRDANVQKSAADGRHALGHGHDTESGRDRDLAHVTDGRIGRAHARAVDLTVGKERGPDQKTGIMNISEKLWIYYFIFFFTFFL